MRGRIFFGEGEGRPFVTHTGAAVLLSLCLLLKRYAIRVAMRAGRALLPPRHPVEMDTKIHAITQSVNGPESESTKEREKDLLAL